MSIDFTDYNRITDVLMYFSDKITLNFTVQLSSNTKTSERRFFSYETIYDSKYGTPLRSIKRSMHYYFVIENRDVFGSGLLLRPQDVELLLMTIQSKVLPWVFGNSDQYAFQIIDNQLVLKEYEPVPYTQSDVKYLIFEPVVYALESGVYTPGVKIDISGNDTVTITIDQFMGFVNILKSDMYTAACALINYAKMEPYGVNVYQAPRGLGARIGGDNNQFQNTGNYSGRATNDFLNNSKSK